MSLIKFNVSGTIFTLDNLDVLLSHPKHKLAKMYRVKEELESHNETIDFIIDRPPGCFAPVVAYYQTGELHMPDGVCPNKFKKELEFWNIPQYRLEKCCMYKFHEFLYEAETHAKFFKYTHPTKRTEANPRRKFHKARKQLWAILDYKRRSNMGKVYLCAVFLLVLASIVIVALDTLPEYRRKPTLCEMLEYLNYTKHKDYGLAMSVFGFPACDDGGGQDAYIPGKYTYSVTDPESQLQETKTLVLPSLTMRRHDLEVIESIIDVFFTVDVMFRLFACSSFKTYFFSFINICDITALMSFYVGIIMLQVSSRQTYNNKWIDFFGYAQIFRIMRLLRVAKHVRASRVLTFSLIQNVEDMTLLGLLLMIVVSTFSCLIYLTEDRFTISSIPQGMYWSIITVTTVGYGDITPVSSFGQVLACILAICGVLLTALTVPMFVNNFLKLYSHSCIVERIKAHIQSTHKCSRQQSRRKSSIIYDSSEEEEEEKTIEIIDKRAKFIRVSAPKEDEKSSEKDQGPNQNDTGPNQNGKGPAGNYNGPGQSQSKDDLKYNVTDIDNNGIIRVTAPKEDETSSEKDQGSNQNDTGPNQNGKGPAGNYNGPGQSQSKDDLKYNVTAIDNNGIDAGNYDGPGQSQSKDDSKYNVTDIDNNDIDAQNVETPNDVAEPFDVIEQNELADLDGIEFRNFKTVP